MQPSRIVAAVAFLALVLLGVEPTLIRLTFVNREPLRKTMERAADRGWYPDYPLFLEGVRAHTPRGARIAVVVPVKSWEAGYDYAFYRANYYLTGRDILPVLTQDNRPFPDGVLRADYVALWGMKPRGGREVWRGNGGVLLQR